ncbi:serine hydrolase domain-containing protein [Mesorhizobium sp. BAC0120]|uniref:serine hydrolase domain-containing protein n=1 Tax=Mesorhizobium sp. BAC0120 TaxID=3090670 RepID=UPI00298BE5CC|nr:serine hydrolase domain-containing protein [Mesorhizobium sp. BAC0120]MDW6021613.1 serine hydrolase domain-containing protein [Mesorhizobium sp. BAC0120]
MSSKPEKIDGMLADYIAQGAVGASIAFALDGQPTETITAGLADRRDGTPVTPDRLFKIGSCTKTFVAAALVRLAADGKVDLGAPIAQWFPDLPGAKEIGVRQLVNHRSGLPEFEYDIPMDPGRVWKPSELVDIAFKAGGQKSPGGPAVYNNTGYVLAGLLIEQVTGVSLGAYVRQAVLEPLSLRDTWSPATEAFPSERLVRGYYHRPPPPVGAGMDIASGGEMWRMEGVLPYSEELQDSSDTFPYSGAYGCGDMVSTPGDLVSFMGGLFAGKVVSPSWFEEMFGKRAPVSFPGTRLRETGAGLFQSSYGGRDFYGHQGSIPGYVCVMQHDPGSGLTIAMASNVGSGNRLSFQASGLHEVVDEAIRAILD